MSAQPVIGNRVSALRRMENFAAEFKRYMLRRPDVVILFAEDYDALRNDVRRLELEKKFRIVRGPSITEYQQEPRTDDGSN